MILTAVETLAYVGLLFWGLYVNDKLPPESPRQFEVQKSPFCQKITRSQPFALIGAIIFFMLLKYE